MFFVSARATIDRFRARLVSFNGLIIYGSKSISRKAYRPCLKTLCPGQAPHPGLDDGEALPVIGEASVASEPQEDPLHHPAPRQDDEAFHIVGPFCDLDAQAGPRGDGFGSLPRVVVIVGPMPFERVQPLAASCRSIGVVFGLVIRLTERSKVFALDLRISGK